MTVIDEQTADSMDPEDLIAQYRAGAWDGSLIRSKDYGTEVSLTRDLTELRYSYKQRVYSEKQDPLGLAYNGYEDPWWYNESLAKKYGLGEHTEIVCDFGYWSMASVKCYPDLPDDFETKRIVTTEAPAKNTLDVLLDNGHLQRYSQTKLLDEWDLSDMKPESIDDEVLSYVKEPFAPSDKIYYLYNDKLYALKSGGKIELMLDHVDAIDRGYDLRNSTLFVVEDGELLGYNMYYGRVRTLDHDVLKLEFNEIMAYKKADGYYTLYHVYGSDGLEYATLYLGEQSLGHYIEYRENLEAAEWYNR